MSGRYFIDDATAGAAGRAGPFFTRMPRLDQAGLARPWAEGGRTIARSASAAKATAPFVGYGAGLSEGDTSASDHQ